MKRNVLMLGLIVLGVGAMSGCDKDKEDEDLLAEYESHALKAQDETESFTNGGMTRSSAKDLHDSIGHHLKEMRSIRMTMLDHCRQAEDCPIGGGATGEMDGSHMKGGQYLDAEHIDAMGRREEQAQTILNDMNESCIGESVEAQTCWGDHGTMMGESFGEIVDACDAMMAMGDDHMGSSSGMGSGMMGKGGN